MASRKNEPPARPTGSTWERKKPAGAPPITAPGDKRSFDARPKASEARSRYEAPRTQSESIDPFDPSDKE